MLVPTYEIIWCHIPENHNLKIHNDSLPHDQDISEESEQQFYIGITIWNNSKSASANVYKFTCTIGISLFWIFHSGNKISRNRNRSTQHQFSPLQNQSETIKLYILQKILNIKCFTLPMEIYKRNSALAVWEVQIKD